VTSALGDSTALARLEQLDRAELAVTARQPVTPGRLPDDLPALEPASTGPAEPGSLRTAWDAVRLPEPVHGWYGEPEVLVTTQLVGLRRVGDDGRPTEDLLAGRTTLAWQHDQCELLDLTGGRCPRPWDGQATPEAMVPHQLLQDLGTEVGDRLQVTTLLDEPERAGTTLPFPSVVEVVGAYRVPLADDTRWLDLRVYRYRAALRDGEREVPPQLPAVIVPYELLDALRVTTVQTTVRRTIDVSDRRAADLPVLRAALAERRATVERTPDAAVPDVPAVAAVDALEPERQALRGVVLVVAAQLLLLSWYVLYLVVATTTAARSDEVALAKLRGRRARSVVGLTLTEPLLLALLAVPAGVLLAWLVTDRAAQTVLRPGTPLFPDRTVGGGGHRAGRSGARCAARRAPDAGPAGARAAAPRGPGRTRPRGRGGRGSGPRARRRRAVAAADPGPGRADVRDLPARPGAGRGRGRARVGAGAAFAGPALDPGDPRKARRGCLPHRPAGRPAPFRRPYGSAGHRLLRRHGLRRGDVDRGTVTPGPDGSAWR
jgi:hypothetical protein